MLNEMRTRVLRRDEPFDSKPRDRTIAALNAQQAPLLTDKKQQATADTLKPAGFPSLKTNSWRGSPSRRTAKTVAGTGLALDEAIGLFMAALVFASYGLKSRVEA